MTIVCWLAGGAPVAAQKTDVIELLNGDRITCEIQKLDRGKVTAKTDGLGTISIEWDDIARVTSAASYDVELASGVRLVGTIERGDSRALTLVTVTGKEPLALDSIVRMARLGRTFWNRLDGSLAAGFSFTQANLQTQWTLNADTSYRSVKWLMSLSANSLLTTFEDQDSQTRNDLSFEAQRFMRPRWSYIGFLTLQQNEALSLNLRSVLGGGFVRILTQSNKTDLEAQMGVAFTREQYSGEGDQSIAEAVAGLSWAWYTFDGRSTSFDFSALNFFALESDSRYRLELNAGFKSDIVGDVYWSINTVESFNSDPPESRKKSDFSLSATLGWTF
jgi:putative salt-induced outer membrane protein YdiY